ncbi:MAG: putative lipid II flippase FtsW [Candidatus Omnitrophica bacterium]|nr:putative lipid II flippase FtsW [Candidatus Omnitrophota bacterium]
MITTVLIAFGLVMIYSASSIYALNHFGNPAYFLKRQFIFLSFGIIFGFLLLGIEIRHLRTFIKPLTVASIILLALVLVPGLGHQAGGARRWFRLGGFSFQPSIMMALVLVVYMADFMSRKEKKLDDFREGVLPLVLVLALVCSLVLLQPDLGTAISIGLIGVLLLYLGGLRLSYLITLLVAAAALFYPLVLCVPYRRARILAFLNPWFDPEGSGFQIIQSQIALASGGFFGRGLGCSQQKLFYLPASHTDFIFSIIGEELGLFGTVSVIALFILLLLEGLKIVKNTKNSFSYLLGCGILLWFALRVVVNIGSSCALLPTKGLGLPFISYGGSSLVFDIAAISLLLNIGRTQEEYG